jgi:hypothetical protein
VTLTNVTLSSNFVTNNGAGGGIYNYAGGETLTNVTLSRNSAYSGAGIYNYDGYDDIVALKNTILDQLIQVEIAPRAVAERTYRTGTICPAMGPASLIRPAT